MRLHAFQTADVALVAGWATTPAERQAWAALDHAPTSQTFAEWHADPDVEAYLLSDGRPVAYGELWVSTTEDEVELGRLIVAPDQRRRGVGRTLVTRLVHEARGLGVSTAWVRVVPENVAALRCYQGAGFTRTSPERETAFNAPQPRAYCWLLRPF